jgi:hypothetical protein
MRRGGTAGCVFAVLVLLAGPAAAADAAPASDAWADSLHDVSAVVHAPNPAAPAPT